VPLSELPDTIDIALDEMAVPDDGRTEPLLASAPFLVEFAEPARLDPKRLDPKRLGLTWELTPRRINPIRVRGPLGSLAIHLLPLLTIIAWPHPTLDIPPLIPIQLVIEQPPPPAQPAEQPPPPAQPHSPGRLASEEFGEVKPDNTGRAPSEAPPAAGEKPPNPAETEAAAVVPRPPPPKPAPPKEQAAVRLPKPSGAAVSHHPEETPHEAQRSAHYFGPTASRDDYLAYLVTLTRQHIDLLPLSVIGARKGETIVSVVVLNNGTISRIGVARSSGYADIDLRIEKMVAAVGKFPPVPQWFQGNEMELELTVHFPEAMEQ